MPISVVCPGCKARFSVSDKYAGKKGPCPKCKAPITIPEVTHEEVKVHVPEDYASGGKDVKGRLITKPIERQETRLRPVVMIGIVAAVLAVTLVAWLLRGASEKTPFIVVGLILISPPLAVAGYSFLRDDELEPYQGRALWIRTGICAMVYALLWGLYVLAANLLGLTGEMWEWLYVGPVFVGLGAVASWASFDLDFGSGALHYSFYLLITLLLCALMRIPPVVYDSPAAT